MIGNAHIPGPNGLPIIYDLHLQAKPSALIILAHGFKSFKDWGAYPLLAKYFYGQGFSVCRFNFSHNGGTLSQVEDFPDLDAFGANTFSKELDDLHALVDHLLGEETYTGQFDQSKTTLVGHSRGGAISVLSAVEDERIKRLVTLNAVSDLAGHLSRYDREAWQANGRTYIRNGRTKQDMPLDYTLMEDYLAHAERYDILVRATGLDTPSLIIHCKDDETVPYVQGMALSSAISQAQLLSLDTGAHTLGAKHPWCEAQLPVPLQTAAEAICRFVLEN